MKKIGVFICTYNGKNYILNCLKSLFCQTIQNFDVYIIDNASTDGTRDVVNEYYKNKVNIISNNENLGGSGGFDRGLQVGLKKQYKYIVLLDNDIILDKNTLQSMEVYLDNHEEVSIVGPKIMIMDLPDIIQEYGAYLDFKKYINKLGYAYRKDSNNLPEQIECDYLASCAMMIRSEVLIKSGTMPVNNFIYYDDIELSHKIKLSGGKIVALSNIKVWHKGGFRKVEVNTFFKYYYLRNRLHFFSKYIEDNEIEEFIDVILYELFSQLFGYYNKGMKEIFQTTLYAFDDYLHEIRGKASDYKIMQIYPVDIPFIKLIKNKKHITIIFLDKYSNNISVNPYCDLIDVIARIQKNVPQKQLWISLKEANCNEMEFKKEFKNIISVNYQDYPLPEILFENDDFTHSDLIFRLCEHVKSVKNPVFPEIYVDKYGNCIVCEDDYKYFTSFKVNVKIFMDMYRPIMRHTIKQIKEHMKIENK